MARRFLKTIEQQVRLFPQVIRGKPFAGACREALRLPLVTMRRLHEINEKTPIVVSDEFDSKYGTETSVRIYPADLHIAHKNWIHASTYFPTPSHLLPDILEGLEVPFERLTFVDLGSGKGRVVLMASQFPFRKVVGVEFSRELHEVATNNLGSYTGTQLCSKLELRCMDFTDFHFPDEPLFIFIYNPASLYLSQVIARHLLESLAAHPRDVWVLYVTPYPVLDGTSQLTLVRSGEYATHPYCLYTNEKRAH